MMIEKRRVFLLEQWTDMSTQQIMLSHLFTTLQYILKQQEELYSEIYQFFCESLLVTVTNNIVVPQSLGTVFYSGTIDSTPTIYMCSVIQKRCIGILYFFYDVPDDENDTGSPFPNNDASTSTTLTDLIRCTTDRYVS
mmetsp:Transcript_46348/g.47050  ORF Transcript_46348/g.47050 Transcript_46348/m.47050 type:complete len:138 (+) Transcript_46348:144-557(+)